MALLRALYLLCCVHGLLFSKGMHVSRHLEGIATAMTRTVVYSSLCVLGFDFVLTAVMFRVGFNEITYCEAGRRCLCSLSSVLSFILFSNESGVV